MAILKNTVLVNNGNTGWTRSNVLDALEEAVADLGWNSGSQRNGVPQTTMPPGDARPATEIGNWNSAWDNAGGPQVITRPVQTHYYAVADDGSSYVFKKYFPIAASSVNTSANQITIGNHNLITGDTVTFFASGATDGGDPTNGSFSNGQTLHVIRINDTVIAVADSAINAAAGTELDLTIQTAFWLVDDRHTDETNIYPDLRQGDTLHLWSSTDLLSDLGISHASVTVSNPMFLQDTTGDYDTDRLINISNYKDISYREMPFTTNGDGGTTNSNVAVVGGDRTTVDDTFQWNTKAWDQTHNSTHFSGYWEYPTHNSVGYHLVSQNNSQYSVEITLLPGTSAGFNTTGTPPHWDYTVPSSGTRSSLDLRVYRTYDGYLNGVQILNLDATGWSDDEVFTIPGDQIGGTSPENDVHFGTNTPETSSNARDGIANIKTLNIGAGVNAYCKSYANNGIIFRLESDNTKKYGTQFYSIKLDNDYQLYITSGVGDVHNVLRQSSTLTHQDLWLLGHWKDDDSYYARYAGYEGLDHASSTLRNPFFTGRTHQRIDYATSSTPTAYPLKVVTYRAQAPQDSEYVVFSFVQTINGNDTPYATWFFHKGTQYGANIWDRDYISVGSWTSIYPEQQSIIFCSKMNGYSVTEEDDGQDTEFNSAPRDALYGYLRSPNTFKEEISYAVDNNMFRDNYHGYVGYYANGYSNVIPYFRHDDYDERQYSDPSSSTANSNDFVGKIGVGTESNFYRPLKGLPLALGLAPQPYYIPDDFVCIQFDITPGQVIISPGDTVEISASEVYEVVCRGYVNEATSYDGVSQNTTKGIVFAARTT